MGCLLLLLTHSGLPYSLPLRLSPHPPHYFPDPPPLPLVPPYPDDLPLRLLEVVVSDRQVEHERLDLPLQGGEKVIREGTKGGGKQERLDLPLQAEVISEGTREEGCQRRPGSERLQSHAVQRIHTILRCAMEEDCG